MQQSSSAKSKDLILFVLLLFFLTLPPASRAQEEKNKVLNPFYGVGFGYGTSAIQGDYIKNYSGSVFGMGFNVETTHFLGIAESGSTTTSESDALKYMNFVLAAGWQRFKIGGGFLGNAASLPTDERLASGSRNITVDYSRETELSVTVAAVFARLNLIKNRNLVIFFDGYYGLYSKGSLTLPIKILGAFDGYVSSEPQKQGGGYGGRFSVLWRLPWAKNLAMEATLRDSYIKMNPVTGPYEQDFFGVMGTATTPDISIRNRTVMVQLLFVM